MAIKLGSSGISKLYLGSTEATKAYLGSVEVYSAVVANPFTFSVNTANAGTLSTQFQLPLVSSGAISMDVDWGDGTTDTITTYNQAETLHTYASSGTYTIEITNEVRGWRFQNAGDKLKILNISNWGDFNFTVGRAFMACNNATYTATDTPSVNTTSMDRAFLWNYAADIDFTGWDMSGVVDFRSFAQQSYLMTGTGVDTWNTSSVLSFHSIFYACNAFDQDISGWDINQGTAFTNCFGSTALSTANYDALLVSWEAQAPQINQTPSFGTAQYTLGSAAATARASLISTYGWTITDGGGIANPAFTFDVNTANAGSASDTFVLPLAADGAINMDVDWGDGNTDNITAYNDAAVTHIYAASGAYTIEITGTIRGWYFNGGGDKAKIINISNWGDFNFTKSNAFKRCANLTSNATDVPSINLTDFSFMFESCTAWNPSNISSWDMSNVTKINWMFFGCTNFNQPIGAWDTSNVYEVSYMLYNCTAFDQDLSGWNVSSITNYSELMGNAGVSTANYDALLVSWNAQAPSLNEAPSFGSSTYTLGSAAATARASLISTYGWTITDGGGI